MAKGLTREEIEYGMKEFVQGLLVGILAGVLITKLLL
jgi:hypothetical protein